MKLLNLMFCEPTTECAEELSEITAALSDLQCWSELSEEQRADLFGKMLGARQAIDHCFRVNFKCDPAKLPQRLEDVKGAEQLAPWSVPSGTLSIERPFLEVVPQLLSEHQQH